MSIQTISDLATGGINKDTPATILPMNTFSDGLNVRFDDGAVSCTTGESLFRTLPISPTYGIHWRRPDQSYSIVAQGGVAYRIDAAGGSSIMLNNAAYNGGRWQGTLFNGGYAVIINNGLTTPLYCLYNDPSAGSSFQPLPNWNYLGGLTVTAKVIRSFNYSLVAANLTLTTGSVTTYAPSTIRISVQAAPGSIPSTWAPGLTTDTADEFEINSTSPILDMAELRGSMFVYSSDSISILTLSAVGTQLKPYSSSYGILNTDCVVEFDGNHLVVDRNDIYIHSGSGQIQSVAHGKYKKWFFNNLNKSYIDKVQVVKNPQYKEAWICFPMGSSTINNMALVFNYYTKTWTQRTLPSATYLFNSPSNKSNAWQYGNERLAILMNSTQSLITDDVYTMWNGSALAPFNSFIERKKLSSGDNSTTTLINSMYPVFDQVPVSTDITIRCAGQNEYIKDCDLSVDNASVSNTFTFLPSSGDQQSYKVDPRVEGRLLNYRVSSDDYWRLALMFIDTKPVARR